MTQLIYSNVYDKKREDIIDLVGIKVNFNNPYYLFFSKPDLLDSTSQEVYFIGYEMKNRSPAFWGYIIKKSQAIIIDDSCNYTTAMLDDMVKSWKRNNYVFASSAVKNASVPRLAFYLLYENNSNFGELERLNYSAAYATGELSLEQIPPDYRNKLEKILEPDDIYPFVLKVTQEYPVLTEKKGNLTFQVPHFVSYLEYARFKAFSALYHNRITREQFAKLYPWEYTLNIFNDLLYYYFNLPIPSSSSVEESVESGIFAEDYPQELAIFMEKLDLAIAGFEVNLNSIDNNRTEKDLYQQIKIYADKFFRDLENRKFFIQATKLCPTFEYCSLAGKDDTECKVYYYPEGHRIDHLS